MKKVILFLFFSIMIFYLYVENLYFGRKAWVQELLDDYGVKVTSRDPYIRHRQEGLSWYYDYGYDWIAYVYARDEQIYYGAIPRIDDIYFPSDAFYNHSNHFHTLIFYEHGLYYSFSYVHDDRTDFHEGYYRRENGQFFKEKNATRLGEILHIYDFTDEKSLLSKENKDKINLISHFEEETIPQYNVLGMRNVSKLIKHPCLKDNLIIQFSNTYQSHMHDSWSPQYSRTGAYYRYDAKINQLYLMMKEEIRELNIVCPKP